MVSSIVYGLLAVALSGQTDCSILYFQSAQCEPCRQFEPVLSQLHQQGWDVRKIEAPAQLDLARQFQIKNLPTVVVLSGQHEVDRVVGVVSFEQLQNRLSRVAARNRSVSSPTPTPQLASSTQTAVDATRQQPASRQQPSPNQPIVRGQSPGSVGPGQGFPLLASNSAANRTLEGNRSTGTEPAQLDLSEPNGYSRPAVQSAAPVQLASASQPNAGPRSNPIAPPKLDRIPQQTTPERAIARATDATVRIKVEESNTIAHGTGTIVAVHGDEALVLTCGHLFREMLPGSQLTVDLFAGTPRQVNLVAQLIDFKADEEDIALLSVRLPVKLEPVPILPRGELVQKGQNVFTIGCDHGNNPTRQDTKVSNINRYLGAANIEIVGAPAVGRSGGGMFDSQGRLLGVCNAACKEDNEGIYAGTEVVYQQLTRIGHAHLFESTASASPPNSLQAVANTSLASGSLQNSTQWPDEDPRLGPTTIAPHQGVELASGANGQASAGDQLVCVLRDATGKERVLTIPQPSPELLQAIERQGVVR